MISIVKHQAVIALLVTILSNFSDCDYCPASAPTVSVVSKCPTNKTEWDQAASRKKCSHMSAKCGDKSPVYHCLLNQWGNETVEVCASTWYISGFCAIYNTDEMKVIDDFERDCTALSEGKCPTRYISSEAYLYQKCYTQKSSNTIPLPDRTEETNDCIMSSVIAIVVTVLVLVITSLVVFITLRLKISKKDEKCMPFCNATKQKAGKKEENAHLMDTENGDNTMNQFIETSELIVSEDAAKSKQMPDIQQKRVHIEKKGVDYTRPRVIDLTANFEEENPPGPYPSRRGIHKPNRKATDPVEDKENAVKKDDIQRTVHNTNNDVEGTLHGNIINIEGNDKENTQSPDSTPSESVTDTPIEKHTEVEQKMDNTIKNGVDFSSPESLINEDNNDEENTQSPDSTLSESVTDTPIEKHTGNTPKNEKRTGSSAQNSDAETENLSRNEDSDAETEKLSQNEDYDAEKEKLSQNKEIEKNDGKVSQVRQAANFFEEKSRNMLNA